MLDSSVRKCGDDDVMFHDESMILNYLNTAMVDFGNGVYTSDIWDVLS